jgi:imidazoleglycerol phosphate synthase glutamine amidotransferase subunit HisH
MLPSTKGTKCCLSPKDCCDACVTVTVDYKAGNLTSVLKALRHLGAEPEVTDGPDLRCQSRRAHRPARRRPLRRHERLDETGLTPAIRAAIARGVPFLGICVGMQWLYAGSSEAPDQPGLGTFRAVRALSGRQRKSPARRLELA